MRARIELKMRGGAKKKKILLFLPPIPFLNAAPPKNPLKKKRIEKLKCLFLRHY
jgi:hypothetical protein